MRVRLDTGSGAETGMRDVGLTVPAAGALVGMGVTVGKGAVAGARAVVVKDVDPWRIVVGNPARDIGLRLVRGQGLKVGR